MNGVQLVYELADPQTIQLTPQEIKLLVGDNNVWSDGQVTMVSPVATNFKLMLSSSFTV